MQKITQKDMNDWFFKYDKKIKTLTGGGEEGHLNYEMQKTKNYLVRL